MMTISYRTGMKYQLTGDAHFWLDFAPFEDIHTEFVTFLRTGELILKSGYAWDGPSGPTLDDETNMQGSAVHDAGYQLMRMGLLDENIFRRHFNAVFEKICLIDGMNPLRAELYFMGVEEFGDKYAKRQNEEVFVCGKQIKL